jgi:molecular chaperone HscB
MTDPFTTLGVPRRFTIDPAQLEQRYRDLSRATHPDKHVQAAPAERRVAAERAVAVNEAFRLLKNTQTRAAALLASVGRTVEEHTRADPALLMEILELREELEQARGAADRVTTVERLRATVQQHVDAAEQTIGTAFDRDGTPDAAQIDRAYEALVKLRYLYRFLEEADSLLEE